MLDLVAQYIMFQNCRNLLVVFAVFSNKVCFSIFTNTCIEVFNIHIYIYIYT